MTSTNRFVAIILLQDLVLINTVVLPYHHKEHFHSFTQFYIHTNTYPLLNRVTILAHVQLTSAFKVATKEVRECYIHQTYEHQLEHAVFEIIKINFVHLSGELLKCQHQSILYDHHLSSVSCQYYYYCFIVCSSFNSILSL